MITELSFSAIKIAILGATSFGIAFFCAPPLIHLLQKKRMWRKTVRTAALGGGDLTYFTKFHSEGEVKTPRAGGILIWLTPLAVAAIFYVLSLIDSPWFEKLNFLSRSQTWIPLGTLAMASAVGFVDDALQVLVPPLAGWKKKVWDMLATHVAGGLSLRYRFVLVGAIGLVGAWWFYAKLGLDTIHVPGVGDFGIGLWYILFFVFVMIATYSGGVIDGIDGLSGGTFASIFAGYGIIAFARGQVDLAAFCMVIVGAILAFLWFNIPPAKFYMSEVGTMGLTATLTVVAFLTDSVLVLPIIGFLLVLESSSVLIQLVSKKIRKKKVFKAAPIHHHFEALGWPPYRVTMRFWIIGIVVAFIGVAIRLLG